MYFLPFLFIKVFSSTWYTICTQQIIVKLNCIIYSLSQFHLLKQEKFPYPCCYFNYIEILAGPPLKSGEHDRIKLWVIQLQNECQRNFNFNMMTSKLICELHEKKNQPPYFSVTPFLDQNMNYLVWIPTYLLHLALNDFWLFPKIKSIFKGQRFLNIEGIQKIMP